MSSPEIAVITTVDPSRTDHLMSTYQSLQEQIDVNWEWCVYFDGPGVQHPLESTSDSRVKVRRGDRSRGAAFGRNCAVLMSRSEFLRNLDADDLLIGTTALSLCLNNLMRPGIGFCVTVTADQKHDGSLTNFESRFTPYGVLPRGYWGSAWIEHRFLDMRAHTLGCRKDLYWVCGGYRAMQFAEDVTLIVSMNELCEGWFERTPSSIYRLWSGQMSAAPERPWELDATYREVTQSVGSLRRWLGPH